MPGVRPSLQRRDLVIRAVAYVPPSRSTASDGIAGRTAGESAVAAIPRIRGPTMPLAVLCAQRGTTWVAALAVGPTRPSTANSGPRGISLAASSLGVALRLPSRKVGSSAVALVVTAAWSMVRSWLAPSRPPRVRP